MAEVDWHLLSAPARHSLQAVSEPAAQLRALGSDGVFWQQMQALDDLPGCAGFHPFDDVTGQWKVELTAAPRGPAATPHEVSAFAAGLTARARRVQPGMAAGGEGAPAVSLEARPPHGSATSSRVDRLGGAPPTADRAKVLAFSMSGRKISGEQQTAFIPAQQQDTSWEDRQGQARAAGHPAPTAGEMAGIVPPFIQGRSLPPIAPTPGAWLALTRIAALVQHIAPSLLESAPGQTALQTPPQAPAPATARATSLLTQYVTRLWPTTAIPAAVPHETAATTPAPLIRAPSLLHPLAPANSDDAAWGKPTTPAPARASPWQPDPAPTDDDLASRLNQALLEQAWLRGVDLT